MKHEIPVDQLGPQGEAMADAVASCVHCGFCLPACPTYHVLGEEMDSPRGRIVLMKEVLEGELDLDTATPYIDRCLGCMGCVTACPSAVAYDELLPAFRAWAEDKRERPLGEKVTRWLAGETLPHPGRMRLAATAARLARPVESLLPGSLRTMLELMPRTLPPSERLPARYPAQGERRARVALLAGCVQNVLAPDINWATLRVLSANGVETVIPAGQGCCGSLAMHTGAADQARSLARKNFGLFPKDVDAIIINAAGCGSGIKEYGLLFAGEGEETAARQFAAAAQDVSEFLHHLGLQRPSALPQPLRVAYHDACHLAHAQGIRHAPRALLSQIPGLTLVEIADGELCCGSAGTYNIEQPAIARELGRRKADNITQVQPDAVVMGNIGCMVQIEQHLAAIGRLLPVYHTMQLLDLAYRGGKR